MKLIRKHTLLYICLLVYVVSVCGLTINKHFCGGELESVSLIKQDSCCGEETEDEASGCCQDEILYLSNKTESIANNVKVTVNPAFHELFFCAANVVSLKQPVLNLNLNKRLDPIRIVRIIDPSVLMVFRI